MVIKNLYDKTKGILNEGISDNVAKLLGRETGDVEKLVKLLPFAKYLELGNAVDIGDFNAAKTIIDDAGKTLLSAVDIPGGEVEESVLDEGDVVDMDKYRKTKTTVRPPQQRNVLPIGTKVRLAAGTIPGVTKDTVGRIVDVADDGRTPTMYKVKTPFNREPILAVEDEIQVVSGVNEADNPYQNITPPSQQLPSKTMAQGNEPAQQSNIGRKDIDDLLPGDDIEVIDIDGEPVATTVKNARGPGDTLVVQDEHRREHIVKKTNVSGTPKVQESGLNEWTVSDVQLALKKQGKSVDPKVMSKLKDKAHVGNITRRDLEAVGLGDLLVESIETIELDRMKTLAGIPSIALVKEEYGVQKGMYVHKNQWLKDAERSGYAVEPSGDGKLIAHVDGNEMGYWDPNYAGTGMGYFNVAAVGKSNIMKDMGAEDVPMSKVEENFYDWAEGGQKIRSEFKKKTPAKQEQDKKDADDTAKKEVDEGFWDSPPKNRRTMKTGSIQSKAIGKTVKIFAGPHQGKTGEVIGAYREPTFSQMVPYVTEYRIKLPDGQTVTTRKDNVRAVKVQPTKTVGDWMIDEPSAASMGLMGKKTVDETASCGGTGAGAIASAPMAVGGMVSRMGTSGKKKKKLDIGGSIYKSTTKPTPKKRTTKENAGDGIGRSKKS